MPKTKILPNGLTLLTIPMTGAKTTAILVMVATGSKHETKQQSGLSHFLEHLFFKGTKHRPDTLVISSELDGLGCEYNAFTDKEYTGFWIKTAAEHITPAINVLSDMLLNSKFDQKEITRESGVITEEVNMYLDNPMMHIEDVFEELLYGDTPAGRSVIGTKANIARFKRQDFVNYFKSQYKTKSIFVCLAGKLPKNPEKILKDAFGKTATGIAKRKPVIQERQSKPAVKISYKKTDQAHFSLGVRTMPYGAKEEAALKVLGTILGGPMSSRLFINLRERNGLCYYVRTQNFNYSDSGYLTTRAGVTVDQIDKAIGIILNEYKKIATELVEEKELARIKRFLAGRIMLGLESPDDIANWYTMQLTINHQQSQKKKIQTPEEYLSAIKKVTSADVLSVAKKIFNPRYYNLAIIGPYKDKQHFIKLLK